MLLTCECPAIACKICVTENLLSEICKFIDSSEYMEFDLLEQIFTLHGIVAELIKNEEFLFEMREFTTKTQ